MNAASDPPDASAYKPLAWQGFGLQVPLLCDVSRFGGERDRGAFRVSGPLGEVAVVDWAPLTRDADPQALVAKSSGDDPQRWKAAAAPDQAEAGAWHAFAEPEGERRVLWIDPAGRQRCIWRLLPGWPEWPNMAGRFIVPQSGAGLSFAVFDWAARVPPGWTLRSPSLAVGACRLPVFRGRAEVAVYAPLSVALFSTGDEVVEPGAALAQGRLYDSNRFTIGAALRALGCRVEDLGILPDDAGVLRRTMTAAAGRCDAVMATGGMSMGEEDHVRAAIEALGSLAFWRIAIKPGRPVGMGLIGDGTGGRTPFVGLPGNPVAALTTFVTVARPLLLTLQGARVGPVRGHPVEIGFDYAKKAGRREFVRVRREPDGADGPEGMPRVVKHGRGGAAMLSSLVGADGFVDLAEDRTHIAAGERVAFLPFSDLLA